MLLNTVLLALLFVLGFIILHHIRLNLRNQLELTRVRDQLTCMNRTLQGLAMLDGLTGLANRRQLDWFLPRAMERALKLRTPLTIMLIDIDAFKAYNDNYGHGRRRMFASGGRLSEATVAAQRRLCRPLRRRRIYYRRRR